MNTDMYLHPILTRYNGDNDLDPDGPPVTWREYNLALLVQDLLKRVSALEEQLPKESRQEIIVSYDDLKDFGYEPSSPRSEIASRIDSQVCQDSVCKKCGHEGLAYQPFVRKEPYSYRAFAICPACGNVEEF